MNSFVDRVYMCIVLTYMLVLYKLTVVKFIEYNAAICIDFFCTCRIHSVINCFV